MKRIFDIELTDEEFDYLMCQQSQGKELKVINDKVVAIEHKVTQQEIYENELGNLLAWFEKYDNQVKQYERCQRMGLKFDKDIVALDNQAKINQERIAELRAVINGATY